MTPRLRILATASSYPPASKAGGPVRSVAGVVREESAPHEVRVATSNRDLGDREPMPGTDFSPVFREGSEVHYIDLARPARAARELIRIGWRRQELLYLNSLFSPWFTLLPLLLWRLGVIRASVVLVAPRGELARSALGIKAKKKEVALPFIRALLRSRRVVWQATSAGELEDIGRFVPSAPIVRHDNPWPTPAATAQPKADKLTLLYAGRIAPIKNPLTAILALHGATGPVRLIMAGVREDATLARRCEEAIARLSPEVEVILTGHQPPEDLATTMDRAHGLILPTSGENFGHAIAEALARGCFVLVPDTTPWTESVQQGAGQLISSQPSASNDAIIGAITKMSPEEAAGWGRRALEIYHAEHAEHLRKQNSLFAAAWRAAQQQDPEILS